MSKSNNSRAAYRCMALRWNGKWCDGEMVAWRGTDGHNGTETFYTCNKCGRAG